MTYENTNPFRARLARNLRTSWATGSSQGMAKCSPFPNGSRVTPVS